MGLYTYRHTPTGTGATDSECVAFEVAARLSPHLSLVPLSSLAYATREGAQRPPSCGPGNIGPRPMHDTAFGLPRIYPSTHSGE